MYPIMAFPFGLESEIDLYKLHEAREREQQLGEIRN